MNSILEHIIKQILLEDRIVAKITDRVSKSEYAAAKAAGAVHAFTVTVKGTRDISKILNMTVKAISKSEETSSDIKIAVGQNSKYANGSYTYIISNPLKKDHQNILVWIVKNPGFQSKQRSDVDDNPVTNNSTSDQTVNQNTDDINRTQNSREIIVAQRYRYIGKSLIMTVNQFEKSLNQENLSTNIDVTNLKKVTAEFETYPLLWTTKDGVIWDVYTTSVDDKLVYIKSGDSWFSVSKKQFESEKNTADAGDLFNDRVTDLEILKQLNIQQPEHVFPRFVGKSNTPIDSDDNTLQTTNTTKSDENPTPTNTTKSDEKPGPTNTTTVTPVPTTNPTPKPTTVTPPKPKPELKSGDVLKFASPANTHIKLLWYSNGKYIPAKENGQEQEWIISSEWKTQKSEQLKYIAISSDKKYYLVSTPDNKRYWVNATHFKK